MAEHKCCPSCGFELPANAGQSFCPACLLRQGLESEAMSLSHSGEPGVTALWNEGVPHRSVLDVLGKAIGAVPSVLLRDTDTGIEAPVVRPSSTEMPADKGRYQILGEIGHGGMGAVLKGRDPDLGRDLAIKVLLEEYHDDPEMTRRFVEEAQIAGQLQHPGIVPVYELGSFDERRPYFTMKLVKGRTLSALLRERVSPAHDLPRLLGIFEQICQTMAYAHARGVIHRDLKPLNIMVGAFGEVQVMDWGLAKVLPKGGTNEETRPQPEEAAASVIRTVRPDSDADTPQARSVWGGTPAYMAPEQAIADVEATDERADVFALGSILCEILTGRPAYTGPSSEAILRKAKRGDTGDAVRRLTGSGAAGELIAVARDCLAADPTERPREAAEVARRMTAYFAGVQDRLRAAELARAAEEARAEEAQATAAAAEGRARAERRSRRMTVGMAASVLIAAALGAAGWRWTERNRMVRLAAVTGRVNTALQEATGLWGQAQGAAVVDLVAWTKALAAAQRARELVEPGLDPSLQRQVEGLLARITSEKDGAEAAALAAESDRLVLNKLVDIRTAKADDPDGSVSDRDYAAAFREAGIDISTMSPVAAAARIKARPEPVAAALVVALDDWTAARRRRQFHQLSELLFFRGVRPVASGVKPADLDPWQLTHVANAASPDPWRISLHRAHVLVGPGKAAKALRDLAVLPRLETATAVEIDELGQALVEVLEPKLAEEVFRAGLRRFPDDVWLNYDFAKFLAARLRGEEALRYYSVARALRPETAHDLGHLLENRGQMQDAVAVFQDLVRRRVENGRHWMCYAELLNKTGDFAGSRSAFDKAVAILRRRIELKPDDSDSYNHLGSALHNQGKLDEAIAAYQVAIRLRVEYGAAHENLANALGDQSRINEAIAEYSTAIRLMPSDASPHVNLGILLCDVKRDYDAAIAEFREAIRLKPDHAMAHSNLGVALNHQGKLHEASAEFKTAMRINPELAYPHSGLGNALRYQGKLDEAIAEYREAIRIKPNYAEPHNNLANALSDQGKLEEAIAEYKTAIRVDPNYAYPHNGLGKILSNQGKLDEAIAEFHAAIRIKTDFGEPHDNLGNELRKQGKLDEAIAECKIAIEINPNDANPHNGLGNALKDQGKPEDAIAEYKTAIRIDPAHATAHNNLAWALALSPKRSQHDYDESLVHARKAVDLAPKNEGNFNTLALAEYRSGRWDESLKAGKRSMELGGGGIAYDWFLQAMAHCQKGDKGEARKWFDKAVAWTKEKDPKNAELRQFWAEAADLLGQPGPGASGTDSPVAPAAEKPR